ncbi:hypothetical protein ECBG_03023 [Enterococcus casseliflavus EC20]|uniref:Apple domain-containing protein n=1 Tax=Enterococcus casseliflavus EC20 TaxID=565655 RepID=C9ACZ5_ENTCA|nr:hypothetical protein [Enterococcus casseliflavus]EEV40754.1 hypothetical protein ECBG_03023 [Enterococcus casseliflavus EC20]
MPFETAYSIEGSYEEITALDANQLFFDGKLTNPNAFQCSADCLYPLTCKSFNKKSTEWKRAPHFCPGKNHTNSFHTCDKEKKNNPFSSEGEKEQERIVEKNNEKILLNIFLSDGFDELKIKSDSKDIKSSDPSKKIVRRLSNDVSSRIEGSQVSSLRRLLHYYYLESFPNDKCLFKTLDNKEFCLNDLFFNLDDSSEIPNKIKVFWGAARIIIGPTYYVVRMKNFCKFQEIISKPSILIQKKFLVKKMNLRNRFDRLSKKTEFTFFYLGKIIVKDNEFLNFEYGNESKLFANLYLKD